MREKWKICVVFVCVLCLFTGCRRPPQDGSAGTPAAQAGNGKQQEMQAEPDQEIPEEAVWAIVSIEDKRFFRHNGVDLRALARAGLALIENGEATQGGAGRC